MNEIDKFFEGLPKQDQQVADALDTTKPASEQEAKVEETKEAVEETESEGRKNRRHRRLEEQLQRERESNIALNERLKVLAEQDKIIKESAGTIDPRLVRVFGTTDEAKEVAKHFTEILAETKESAREEAVRELEERQIRAQQEEKQYESFIDNQLESIEDQFDVDLTSNAPQARKTRREFLEMVEQLSPKDQDGTITDYADFGSTFEVYQSRQPKVDNSRQKEVASRSMQRSGQSTSGQAQITPGFRGWEKDLGIN